MNSFSLLAMMGALFLSNPSDSASADSVERPASIEVSATEQDAPATSDSKDGSKAQELSNTPPPSTWDKRQSNTAPVPEDEGVTLGMQALKTLFGLGIVLGLLFLSSRLVAKRLGTTRWQSREGRLKVEDFMLLDGKTGVYIVTIDGIDWVVTTGPHGTAMQPKEGNKRSFSLAATENTTTQAPLDLASGSLVESGKGEHE